MAISLASAAWVASTAPLALASAPVDAPQMTFQQDAEQAAPVQPEAIPDPAAQATSPQQPAPQQQDEADAAPPSGNTIVVTGASDAQKKDPLVEVNEAAFAITQKVDEALVEPIADVYEDDLPSPIRKGLRNFFRNLLEPITALNYFLQLKPGKAFETVGRFALNTTIGVGGLFDVAKKEPFGLPYRRNGFGNTLGYYGVGPGPFLVLPLIGATTLRDLAGSTIDQSILPFAVGKPFNTPLYAVPAYTVNSLEFRIKFDERLEQISTSDDPYYAMRETYLCQREAEIAALKNRPPPRDCSIEAIMGLDADTVQALLPPGSADAALPSDTQPDMAPEPEPQPPAIVYVSEPVIQPLPAGYSPAAPPSN